MYITKYITVYYGILLWLILLIIIYKISISKKKKKNYEGTTINNFYLKIIIIYTIFTITIINLFVVWYLRFNILLFKFYF